jgi:hypothetical protein
MAAAFQALQNVALKPADARRAHTFIRIASGMEDPAAASNLLPDTPRCGDPVCHTLSGIMDAMKSLAFIRHHWTFP